MPKKMKLDKIRQETDKVIAACMLSYLDELTSLRNTIPLEERIKEIKANRKMWQARSGLWTAYKFRRALDRIQRELAR